MTERLKIPMGSPKKAWGLRENIKHGSSSEQTYWNKDQSSPAEPLKQASRECPKPHTYHTHRQTGRLTSLFMNFRGLLMRDGTSLKARTRFLFGC